MTEDVEYYDEYLPFKSVIAGWVLGLLSAGGLFFILKWMGLV